MNNEYSLPPTPSASRRGNFPAAAQRSAPRWVASVGPTMLLAAAAVLASGIEARADHGPPQQVRMQPGTLAVCNGVFTDSSAFIDSYDSVEDWVLTLAPNDPTSEKVRLVFSEFDTEPQFTRMRIYDGNSTGAPLIGSYDGNNSPGTVISTAPDGSLTIEWFAGARGFPNYTGWHARLTCVQAVSVNFHASGQSMWGPGSSARLPDSARVEFLTINYDDFRPDRNVVNILGSQFGASVFAGLTGDVGFLVRFEDISPGSVGVNYPVQVTLAGPNEDEFRPGDWVTIDSRARVKPEDGPFISATSPEVGVDLDARATISANVTAEGCVFSCQSFNLFPSVNLAGVGTIVGLEPNGNEVQIVTENISGIGTPFDIPLPIEALTGIGGTLDRPDLSRLAPTGVSGNALVASGTDEFMTLSMDIDTWILRALGAPPALRLEIPEIPIFTVLGRWTVFGRYRIMDLKVDTDFHEDYTYSFTPTIHITLDFGQPVEFRILRGGSILTQGTGSVLAFNAGDSVQLKAPDAAINVVPTISLINPVFHTQTSTRFVRSFREKMMELGIRVPGQHIGCFPSIGPCPVCTPSFCANSPEINLNVGPLIDLDEPFDTFTDSRLFQRAAHSFPLQGLNQPGPSAPFAVDPEFKPVAVLEGPLAPFNEGDVVAFSAAQSSDRDGDPLTYHWSFGDGGAATGPEVTHAYGDNGTFHVILTVDDGHGFPASAVHEVTVLNVPADLLPPANPILDFDEGELAVIPTLATDPGFLDRHVTVADFGDGSPASSSYPTLAVDGPIPWMNHVYADEGEYTVNFSVTDDDGEGDSESTIARIHNVAPTVNALHDLLTKVSADGQSMEVDLRLFVGFNDPGTLDTHTARLEWGDGTIDDFPLTEAPFGPPGSFQGADGQGIHEYVHIYNTPGSYDVRVCVTDDDGGETCVPIETIEVVESDLQIEVAVAPESATPLPVGSEATYTVTVTNQGPDAAPDVLIENILPEGMELVSAVRSSDGQLETRLTLDDAREEDAFGTSVKLDGDTLLVGAIRFELGIGEVRVYRAAGVGWTEEATLISSDAGPFAFSGFGINVDLSGDTAIVGADTYSNESDESTGAAYVFRRTGTTWTEEARLIADDAASGDGFGAGVAIHDNTVVVSAPNNDGGAVYVFERDGTTWTQTDKFTIGPDRQFGNDVAITSDTIVATSPGSPFVSPSRPGSVTIFRRNGADWAVEATLEESTLSDHPDPSTFGGPVTITDDTLMVGTLSFFNPSPTRVHVFERNGTTWTQQATILADDATNNDRFGNSLHFDGESLAVGARDSGSAGATYVFRRNGDGWNQAAKLTPADAANNADVGASVSMGNGFVAFGASNDRVFDNDGNIIFSGAAYIVTICPENPTGTINCVMGDIPSGESAVLQVVARVGCMHATDPFVPATLTNNASVSSQALDFAGANNDTAIASTTASPPQGVCGADFTPPIITPVVSGTIGDNGWYTSDVTVTWVVIDNDSQILSDSGCGPTTIDFDTTGTTLTCSATSVGGTASNSITIKRDATPPLLTPIIAGTAGNNGWHTSDVEVSFDCTDATSGIANCSGTTLLSDEGINPCVFGNATDQAGNTASATVDGIKIDKSLPVLTASRTPANANGWSNDDVVVTFECADSVSGIAQCPTAQTVIAEGAGQSVTGTATDQAGNTVDITIENINIDRTPPTITADATPPANAAGWRNTIVNVSFNCTDDLSGVDQCSDPIVLAAEGMGQSAAGSVTDRAGNTANATVENIHIDWTPPTIVANASPPPIVNGLNDPGVTISFSCNDDLSGVADCPADVELTTIGLDQGASGAATDVAGNTASTSVSGIHIGDPQISTSNDRNTTEGTTVDLVLASITQFDATTGTVTVDWGDSAPTEIGTVAINGSTAEVSGSHVYADDGSYTVTVCTEDLLGRQVCDSITITVSNQPPVLQSVDTPTEPVVSGSTARLMATLNDLGSADAHTATIDWGDGTEPETVEVVEAPFGPPGDPAGVDGTVHGAHEYALAGDYIGQICVTDDEGAMDCRSFSLSVAPPLPITCRIEVGTITCNGTESTIPLQMILGNVADQPVNYLWESDNPDGVFNDLEDNDFGDPTISSPTLVTQALTSFNVQCTAIFSDESGLSPVTCEVFLTPCGAGISDLDCDGSVSVDDINPFVLALTDPAGYDLMFPDCDRLSGDCNGDGVLSLADINCFVAHITGG